MAFVFKHEEFYLHLYIMFFAFSDNFSLAFARPMSVSFTWPLSFKSRFSCQISWAKHSRPHRHSCVSFLTVLISLLQSSPMQMFQYFMLQMFSKMWMTKKWQKRNRQNGWSRILEAFWGDRWLQISEDDFLSVQVLEGIDRASHVEFGAFLLCKKLQILELKLFKNV